MENYTGRWTRLLPLAEMGLYYMPHPYSHQPMSPQSSPSRSEHSDFSSHSVLPLSPSLHPTPSHLFPLHCFFVDHSLLPPAVLSPAHYSSVAPISQQFSNALDFKDHRLAFSELYTSNSRILNRMRLTCQSTRLSSSLVLPSDVSNGNLHTEDFTPVTEGGGQITHAMNEVILHRGKSPHLTMLDISIDGVYLTEAIVPLPCPLLTTITIYTHAP